MGVFISIVSVAKLLHLSLSLSLSLSLQVCILHEVLACKRPPIVVQFQYGYTTALCLNGAVSFPTDRRLWQDRCSRHHFYLFTSTKDYLFNVMTQKRGKGEHCPVETQGLA